MQHLPVWLVDWVVPEQWKPLLRRWRCWPQPIPWLFPQHCWCSSGYEPCKYPRKEQVRLLNKITWIYFLWKIGKFPNSVECFPIFFITIPGRESHRISTWTQSSLSTELCWCCCSASCRPRGSQETPNISVNPLLGQSQHPHWAWNNQITRLKSIFKTDIAARQD